MTDVVKNLALPLGAGAILGLFYFGGLWLTVKSLPTARSPAFLSLLSFAIRTIATLAGFYLVMAGTWERLFACMAGFFVVRLILVKHLSPGLPPERQRRR